MSSTAEMPFTLVELTRTSEVIITAVLKSRSKTSIEDPFTAKKSSVEIPVHTFEVSEVLKSKKLKSATIIEVIDPAEVVYSISDQVSSAVTVFTEGRHLRELKPGEKTILFLKSGSEAPKVGWSLSTWKATLSVQEKAKVLSALGKP